jgi:hypothetical protein
MKEAFSILKKKKNPVRKCIVREKRIEQPPPFLKDGIVIIQGGSDISGTLSKLHCHI